MIQINNYYNVSFYGNDWKWEFFSKAVIYLSYKKIKIY